MDVDEENRFKSLTIGSGSGDLYDFEGWQQQDSQRRHTFLPQGKGIQRSVFTNEQPLNGRHNSHPIQFSVFQTVYVKVPHKFHLPIVTLNSFQL